MSTRQGSVKAVGIGIMSLFLISMDMSYIQVIMPKIYEHFSGTPMSVLTYILSVAALFGIIGGLGAGALLARRKIGYRTCAIAGTCMFVIGGALPAFIHGTWITIMCCRAVLGLGMGTMSVLANPLVSAFYSADQRARLLSIGTAIAQCGAMFCQLVAGYLADIDMWYAFLADGIGILSILGAIFLIKEPSPKDLPETHDERGALPPRVWMCAIISFIACLSIMPLLFNFSWFVQAYSSSSFVASTVQVSYTIGMICGGLLYMLNVRIFKRFCLTAGAVCAALGILIFMNAPSIHFMYLGEALAGIGYGQFMPALLQVVGFEAKPTMIGFATSLVTGAMNLAAFFVSPYLNAFEAITGDALVAPIYGGVAIFAIIAVVTAIVNPFSKRSVNAIANSEAIEDSTRVIATPAGVAELEQDVLAPTTHAPEGEATARSERKRPIPA